MVSMVYGLTLLDIYRTTARTLSHFAVHNFSNIGDAHIYAVLTYFKPQPRVITMRDKLYHLGQGKGNGKRGINDEAINNDP